MKSGRDHKEREELKMKKGSTELVFILDRSGSMSGLESDTIGGFNAVIREQKKNEGDCLVTTVLFNTEEKLLHDRLKLTCVPEMTENDYRVGGCTALLDAIGHTIRHISEIHRYAREEDVPEKTLFMITTDGMENASTHFSRAEVKRLIEKKKEESGWEFIFVAANIDAEECASSIGIDRENAVEYQHDVAGTQLMYESMNLAAGAVRANKKLSAAPQWREALDKDNKKRGGRRPRR